MHQLTNAYLPVIYVTYLVGILGPWGEEITTMQMVLGLLQWTGAILFRTAIGPVAVAVGVTLFMLLTY